MILKGSCRVEVKAERQKVFNLTLEKQNKQYILQLRWAIKIMGYNKALTFRL